MLIACAAIIILGIRFFVSPQPATPDFGVAVDNLRALAEIKGARDITSGLTNGKTYRARHPPDHRSTARSARPRPGTGVSYTNEVGALMLRPNRLKTGAPAFRAGLNVA